MKFHGGDSLFLNFIRADRPDKLSQYTEQKRCMYNKSLVVSSPGCTALRKERGI